MVKLCSSHLRSKKPKNTLRRTIISGSRWKTNICFYMLYKVHFFLFFANSHWHNKVSNLNILSFSNSSICIAAALGTVMVASSLIPPRYSRTKSIWNIVPIAEGTHIGCCIRGQTGDQHFQCICLDMNYHVQTRKWVFMSLIIMSWSKEQFTLYLTCHWLCNQLEAPSEPKSPAPLLLMMVNHPMVSLDLMPMMLAEMLQQTEYWKPSAELGTIR